MRKFLAAAAVVAVMAVAASAQAAALNFDITNIDVTVTNGGNPFCLGCSVSGTAAAPPASFNLAAGASNTFKFADFDLYGLGFGSATIDAKLTFDSPISGSVDSTGSANYVELFGVLTGGSLTWSAVPTIATSNGSTFDVSFENLGGLAGGSHVADYVTITARNVTAGVPEPASWALMIGGFGMAGAMLRRRRPQAATA